VPISTLPPQMLQSTMPISLATQSQSSVQSSTTSAATMNGLHPNATYYPMQFFYYPTQPISQSIYLQTGQMHPAPMTLVLRGKLLSQS
jgi:hypothetical protein